MSRLNVLCFLSFFSTLAVMRHRLQQEADEHLQLLRLATGQKTQNDGGAGGCRGFALELTSCFAAQTSKKDPGPERVEFKPKHVKLA